MPDASSLSPSSETEASSSVSSPSAPPPRAESDAPIAAILEKGQAGDRLCVRGWVRTHRQSKRRHFIEINDGSSLANLQLFIEETSPLAASSSETPSSPETSPLAASSSETSPPAALESNVPDLTAITLGSSLEVEGVLAAMHGRQQRVELHPYRLHLHQQAALAYPLQKKRHGFEYLRTVAHLRPRTNTFGAVHRVRNALFVAVHAFFQQRGFTFLQAPIITASDAEGAGALFQVTTEAEQTAAPHEKKAFFGAPAALTVSGQLAAEAFAHAFSRVYTFGPTFRAENSHTARHAAEFWMIEPELAFATLADIRQLAQAFVQSVVQQTREACPADFAFFAQRIFPGLPARLEALLNRDFHCIDYSEAIERLERAVERKGAGFEYPVRWGVDLQSEHERYLVEALGGPTFVCNYPRSIKAFYMRLNDAEDPELPSEQRTVAAMDLLLPGIGELIGGSQREERLEVLRKTMQHRGISTEDYRWYLDLRRYGSTPHAGFGVGFERLLMYLTGMQNIRDVIPFPRVPGTLAY